MLPLPFRLSQGKFVTGRTAPMSSPHYTILLFPLLASVHCTVDTSKARSLHVFMLHLQQSVLDLLGSIMCVAVSKNFTFIIVFYTRNSPYQGASITIFIILIFKDRNLKGSGETELDGRPYLLMAQPVTKLLFCCYCMADYRR